MTVRFWRMIEQSKGFPSGVRTRLPALYFIRAQNPRGVGKIFSTKFNFKLAQVLLSKIRASNSVPTFFWLSRTIFTDSLILSTNKTPTASPLRVDGSELFFPEQNFRNTIQGGLSVGKSNFLICSKYFLSNMVKLGLNFSSVIKLL